MSNPLIDICKRYLAACNAIELSEEATTLSLDSILETVPLDLIKFLEEPQRSHSSGGAYSLSSQSSTIKSIRDTTI